MSKIKDPHGKGVNAKTTQSHLPKADHSHGKKAYPQNALSENEFLAGYNPQEFERPSVSVDTVVFSVDTRQQTENIRKLDEQKLTVLLVKRDTHPFFDKWSLPGGFVGITEPLDSAARRVLRDKTGLDELYLEQLYTFGAPNRDPRMRIISCAYLSLIDRSKHFLIRQESNDTQESNNTQDPINSQSQNQEQDDTTETTLQTAWFEIEFSQNANTILMKSSEESLTIPVHSQTARNGKIETLSYVAATESQLAFDHATLILEGLLRLRSKVENTDIVFNLMPERFPISDLQQIYEIILGRKLLTPLFRRQIAPKIEGTGSYTQEKGHRPSQLFRYKIGAGP
ncbi:MAG: NUDIX hydrolase [Peptococcaceae bacterium]|nr:NUDIX hydrolase [Peptococcaceae bacterium]